MIGRQRTGSLSTNQMMAFRHSFSKEETRFKGECFYSNGTGTGLLKRHGRWEVNGRWMEGMVDRR